MMSSKRSLTSSKSGKQHTGKLKEMPTSSRTKEPKLPDLKDFTNVPVIRQMDNARLVPKYTSILSKTVEEGVVMDDLDQLQHDLEKLLSTNALRTRFFLGEYTQADKDDKKTNMTAKRKKPDERTKFREVKGGIRFLKRDPFKLNEHTYKEIPKISLPRNDNSDKFWASIEPYCAPVSKDNVAFLDSLLQEFSKEIDTKIPEVGEHYSKLWSDELLGEEHSVGRPFKKIQDKKNGVHSLIESFGSVLTQRLLAATIQDKVLEVGESASNAEATGSTKNGDDCKTGENKTNKAESTRPKPNSHKVGTCLDRRLLKELVEQGILTKEDVQQEQPEDELLKEIKKCQDELFTINEYNLDELNKLRSAVLNDIHCNQLKDDLDKVDKQLLDLYNSFMVAVKQPAEGKDEKVFTEKMKTDFEIKANALLRQQHVLNREINSMTDMSMLY
ncbi:unnamed protein product [Ceutorhynchus assimilis]|uniref:Transcriptional adapter 3 n=1 Tax=Ceutorhynchus assimilis TaxID=467358 RepID=A0A9N9QRE1_9CUCU|nr:unnamed protein product [Ceutorhynchus assimilis]